MSTRVSTSQIFGRSQDNVARARSREATSSEKAATGRELVRPSDNPAGYIRANALKDDLSVAQQMSKNATMASRALGMTETAMAQVQEILQRSYELAIQMAGNQTSHRELALEEVEALYDATIQALNGRYGARSLLAGYKSDRPAFASDGSYQGDSGRINIELGRGLDVPINITGDRAVLGKGIREGVNILDSFKTLIAGLKNDDTEKVQASLDLFVKSNNQISLIRGEIGARMSQIESVIRQHGATEVDSVRSISEIEDADVIKVFSDLSRDQTVLNAAISTTRNLLTNNPTQMFYK